MGFAKNNHKNTSKKKELHQENHFLNIPASNPVRLIMNTIKAINERETPVESIDEQSVQPWMAILLFNTSQLSQGVKYLCKIRNQFLFPL